MDQTLIGIVCLVVGAAMLIGPYLHDLKKKPPTVIAVHQQSFDGNTRDLSVSDLPAHLQKAQITRVRIDQGTTFNGGILEDPKAALRQQSDLKARISALLRAHPDGFVAYCGKVHIPLAFTAAHQAFSEIPIVYFELDRATGGWRHLDQTSTGPNLGLTRTVTRSGVAGNGVVRIEVSYPIKDEDIAAIVPAAAAEVAIRISEPRIDCITTARQVEDIAKSFRAALDELRDVECINVFISAPMSVVVALGRLMSPTIHGAIIVHNFTDKTTPHYAWGVDVNAKGGPAVVKNRKNGK